MASNILRHAFWVTGLVVASGIACGGSQQPDGKNPAAPGTGGTGASGGTGGDSAGTGGSSKGGGTNGGSAGKSTANGGSAAVNSNSGAPNLPPGPPGCGLDNAAFCETFDEAHPGGYAGDLDENVFTFSRWAGQGTGFQRLRANSTEPDWLGISTWSNPDGPPVLCGKQFTNLLPPDDAVICNGQFNDVMIGDGLPINSLMIKQPFDFTGRTGTVVFDVDAKRNDGFDGHGWWLEMWITDQPTPIPYHEAPTVASIPRNGVGIQIAPFNDAFETDPQTNQVNGVNGLVVVKDGELVRDTPFGGVEGPVFRVKDQYPNRFRVELSKDRIAVSTSNYDEPDRLLTGLEVKDLGLNFEVGWVHFQHVHYNPPKVANCECDPDEIKSCQCDCDGRCKQYPQTFYASITQVYRWDNLGFDGPVHAVPRTYRMKDKFEKGTFEDNDVELTLVDYGYNTAETKTFEILDVDLTDAQSALFNFDTWSGTSQVRVRYNGHEWHTQKSYDPGDAALHAFSIDAPLDELVPGTNSVEIDISEVPVGNIDITVFPKE